MSKFVSLCFFVLYYKTNIKHFFRIDIQLYQYGKYIWENSKLCENTPPFGYRVVWIHNFSFFLISTRVDITDSVYQHGKYFIFVKYTTFDILCHHAFMQNSITTLRAHDAVSTLKSFSYPEPFLRAARGARRGALAKSISNWHLIGYNEGYCSNTGYILLPCFHGIRLWIWPEPILVPRALLTRGQPSATRGSGQIQTGYHKNMVSG